MSVIAKNLFHAWVMENHPDFSDFIKFAGNIVRLNAESRGTLFAVAIPAYIEEHGLDYDTALDAFIAYEVFKRELWASRA
jgi:hypothetical protein